MLLSMPLLALVIASFGIGTTEFVIMGLLPDVARDLRVSIPAAGLLVSAYALGVTVGAPIMVAATARLSRKTALVGLMGVFTLGNLCCALAGSYALLVAARVLTAFAHGAFFGIGSVVAAQLFPAKRAQAIAVMMSGLTLANVLGVPFGTFVGQAAGWRMPFWVVTGIGVASFLMLLALLPKVKQDAGTHVGRELKALVQPQVMMPMAISVLASISLFTTFTYITPLLETVTGLLPRTVSWALLLFGGGLTIGNLVGGRLADREPVSAIIGSYAALILLLIGFSLTASHPIPAVLALIVWGALVFSLVPPLQIWIVDAAVDAPSMASSINHGAFNFGNATGAWLGGVFIGAGYGYATLPWISAGVAALALLLTVFSGKMRARALAAAAAAD